MTGDGVSRNVPELKQDLRYIEAKGENHQKWDR